MADPTQPDNPVVAKKLYHLFRDYFDRAEKKRRWSMKEDIPWDKCNKSLNPAIADVVETFCAVELYLPDYLSKLIPQVRANRGRAWMLANWGYEESKHSMVLSDWLFRSGQRSDEEMVDMERRVFAHEWDLPHDSALAMICYTTVQELATALHYRNLRKVCDESGGDPALSELLRLISIDECAHYDFFLRCVQIYLEADRPATLEALRRVLNDFKMPAIHMLFDGQQRIAAVQELKIFDFDIYYRQVFEPILERLGLTRVDLRRRNHSREIMVVGGKA